MNKLFKIFLVFFAVALLAACSSTEALKKRGGYLLVKNKVHTDNSYLKESELISFMEQTPIKHIFATWFRPGIWLYEESSGGGQNRLKRFVRKNFGTQPVILDSTKINTTLINLKQFVTDKGFFHSDISYKVKTGKTTAQVYYNIKAGYPCIVKKINYNVSDSTVLQLIKSSNSASNLKQEMIYDTYVLDDERLRITNMLRDRGYFSFMKNHIYYVIDTAKSQKEAEITMIINKYKVKSIEGDTIREINHPQYVIDKINIETEKYQDAGKLPVTDTLIYKYHIRKSDTNAYAVYLQSYKLPWLKPSFFSSNLKFFEGQLYRQTDANLTYKRLINHPIIKSVKININPSPTNTMLDGDLQKVDYFIKISQNLPNALSFGTEGTNSEGRLGMGANVTYMNKNLFKGGEVFSFKIRTNGDIQANTKDDPAPVGKIFTAFGWGAEAGVDFPRILFPFKYPIMQRVKLAKTSIGTSLRLDYRPDITIRGTALGITYNWEQSNEKARHILTPFEFNYIKTKKSSDFQAYLNTQSSLYKAQFTDHFLSIIKYSVIYTDAITSTGLYRYFLRVNLETSGNLIYAIDKAFKNPLKEGYYEHLGVRYSQYFKTEIDFQRFWRYNLKNTLAFRFNTGFILPYGNSIAAPYEKSFWLGGANDMRGWKLRSLGPGGYSLSGKQYDKLGDILLSSSVEGRFPISGIVHGALFADIGNVWLLKKNPDFPDGEFNLSTFAKQIAFDAGLGVRIDASFLVLRVDLALKLHNPNAASQKWVQVEKIMFRDINWNFGIGYPF